MVVKRAKLKSLFGLYVIRLSVTSVRSTFVLRLEYITNFRMDLSIGSGFKLAKSFNLEERTLFIWKFVTANTQQVRVTCGNRSATSMARQLHTSEYNMIGTPTFEVAASIILGESGVVRPYRTGPNQKKKEPRDDDVLSYGQRSALSEPQITVPH